MNIYWDTEFTGLHKDTSLISIGMVADNGKEFYAELTDYKTEQIDSWIEENVINNLLFRELDSFKDVVGSATFIKGDRDDVGRALETWLLQFGPIDLWSDCDHYDVVLFIDLFGTAFDVPGNVCYIPFDLSTALKVLGLDPDINREAFIDRPIEGVKHNSLYDARVIQSCYYKLQRNKGEYLKNLV